MATIAAAGVPWRGLTRFKSPAPGIPSSRAKAHHIRPIEVIDARPQSVPRRVFQIVAARMGLLGRLQYAFVVIGTKP